MKTKDKQIIIHLTNTLSGVANEIYRHDFTNYSKKQYLDIMRDVIKELNILIGVIHGKNTIR